MYGWPVLVHYCDNCSYNTPIEYSPSVWTQKHTCTHCGSRSRGADVAGESKGAMNSTQHDELAQLFAHNMQLSQLQDAPIVQQQQSSTTFESDSQFSEKKIDSPLHFVSAHYTHTAHVRAESEPSRSPPPAYNDTAMPQAMAETLLQNSIDPSALLPNQINLFVNADYEQRLRLLELWRISPPSYPLEQHLQAETQWVPTSVDKEENAARERYEQQMQLRVAPEKEHLPSTASMDQMSSIRGPGEPAWPPAARMRAASIAAGISLMSQTEAEPYVINGYENASNKQSVDPVYAAGLWSAPSYAQASLHRQTSMQDQYGMYEQVRNHADWERMNEQIARERFTASHGPVGLDDEMIM